MDTNKSLEEKLRNVSSAKALDREICNQIIDYLLSRLGGYLQQQLRLIGENKTHKDSFSTTFRGVITPQDPFRISFVGILGMGMNYDEDKPHYSASGSTDN